MKKTISILLLLMFLSINFFSGCTVSSEDEQIIKSVVDLKEMNIY